VKAFFRTVLLASLVLMLVLPARAATSSYTIDQINNAPTTFTVSDMTQTALASTSTRVQVRLNYTTLSLPGKFTVTPSTISGTHNTFSPTNISVSCAQISGIGTFNGLTNVRLTAGGVTCGTMPANSTGQNIIVTFTVTIDDTALAPSAFGADTYNGSVTLGALDG
jgi:hypothetical protein